MSRDGHTLEVIEQVAFIDVGPDGIAEIDLLCSGFLPAEEPVIESPRGAASRR
jgi:hypothetical protein